MDDWNYWSETRSRDPSTGETPGPDAVDPQDIGRYRIVRRLGEGSFGRVYLAQDHELDRHVAIKVPSPQRIADPKHVEAYLAEARVLAKLDHRNIVPVYDVGRTDDGLCYLVSKYIDGSDLAEWLKQGRPPFRESLKLTAVVAGVLHYVHTRGLVHRDIKPANILIDRQGLPCVADFGLALKDDDYGKGAQFAGTPAYMSPEQARGEGHRVDGRSDLFSLGVVLYELLTGRKPFHGDSRAEVMDQIATADPRPLRHIDDTIPRELEWICQKALSKRASERYSTGRDMADDLRQLLQKDAASGYPPLAQSTLRPQPGATEGATPPPPTLGPSISDGQAVKIIPKGLRSFDRHDADFFLELLPGPRNSEGLPESLRFWKARIEEFDADRAFRVGLIYGPSGCGKSSLVKAGLLPRLSKNVLPVYIEATPDETEARLLRGLRRTCPDLSAELGLVDSLAVLRRGQVLTSGRKVLLVLDQFEQCQFARRDEDNPELVAALRQCDGEHVQAVVMVRDDFWMAVTRFLRDIEIDLVPDENVAVVDLFDLRHARNVLAAFGHAYGTLPKKTNELSNDQLSFLDEAISGLAQDGKIVSVRLALFADMVKGKPWTPTTLREVGGTEGIGVTFLEESFGSPQANPKHRLHQKAAQAVLEALLPETGTDIKFRMRSEDELRDASGYAGRPRDFDDVIRILDPELHLITPTDPEGAAAEGQTARPGGPRYYQLTHDYLVHSLREWLIPKQRETRQGRAGLRLAEQAALWNAKPENRRLPTFLEWASIRTLTHREDWTDPQRRMMRRAGRVHGLRAVGVAAALVALLSWVGVEAYGNLRASALVESLRTANISDVPVIVERMSVYRRWVDRRLRSLVQTADYSSRDKLNASLALLSVDLSQLPFLENKLLDASPSELPVLRDALSPHRAYLTPKLWTVLESAKIGDIRLLPAAGALAVYDPAGPNWQTAAEIVAPAIVAVDPVHLGSWLDVLRPIRGRLAAPLAAIFRDKARPEIEHFLATHILFDYARDDPESLAELMMIADPTAYKAFFLLAERQTEKVLPLFQAELAMSTLASGNDASRARLSKDELAERQARAALALLRMGKADVVWPLLRHSGDPRLRSFVINWLNPLGADSKVVAAEFDRTSARLSGSRLAIEKSHQADVPQKMDAILFQPETSITRALILALGTYPVARDPDDEPTPLAEKLLKLYRDDPDAGIHSAAEWTLRKWVYFKNLDSIDREAAKSTNLTQSDRRWYRNAEGLTFSLIDGPVKFNTGSPETDTERNTALEAVRKVLIPRRFVVSTKEVTVAQFQRFSKEAKEFEMDAASVGQYSPDPDGPCIAVSWYGAAAYCNWLSKKDGLSEKEWCYQRNKSGEYAEGMGIPADVLKRTGYRLPTEVEWEYACRAGAHTSRYYGVSVDLLAKYALFLTNSGDRASRCGSLLPNDLGIFDTLGSVYEWCQDHNPTDIPSENGVFQDIIAREEVVLNKTVRMFRGGSFRDPASEIRSAHRSGDSPTYVSTLAGFRVARTPPQVSPRSEP